MKFDLVKISGLDDAIIAMMYSKRHYDKEKADWIRNEIIPIFFDRRGKKCILSEEDECSEYYFFKNQLHLLYKYGITENHTTLLRFIDFTVEVTGLHRAAQDDLDSHAMRMNNRIVRTSTRFKKDIFTEGEKSEYYKGKVLTTAEMMESLGYTLPDTECDVEGNVWVKVPGGYVLKEHKDNPDVLRGLYPLMIPSDCIWKCNFTELRHIYTLRNNEGHAHPELVEGIEDLAKQIEESLPILGKGIKEKLW